MKTQTEHTPTPWINKSGKVCRDFKDGYAIICEIVDGSKADAHLITAAPDLLEAAKLMLMAHGAQFPEKITHSQQYAADKLEAAISKAKGGK